MDTVDEHGLQGILAELGIESEEKEGHVLARISGAMVVIGRHGERPEWVLNHVFATLGDVPDEMSYYALLSFLDATRSTRPISIAIMPPSDEGGIRVLLTTSIPLSANMRERIVEFIGHFKRALFVSKAVMESLKESMSESER